MKTTAHYLIYIYLLLYFISCSEDNEPIENSDKIEDCHVDEYYARMLINGKCWTSDIDYFVKDENYFSLLFINDDYVDEYFDFNIPNLEFGRNQFNGNIDHLILLSIIEGGDALVTYFEPRYLTEKDLNWIELEDINSDTTIISGRFEAVLYRNNPQGNQSIYQSPEKLVITDGQFRVQRRE